MTKRTTRTSPSGVDRLGTDTSGAILGLLDTAPIGADIVPRNTVGG